MERRKDTSGFVNPAGYWQYEGAYTVQLTEEADHGIVPDCVIFEGSTASITHGRIKQTMGGIQMYAGDAPFHWGYKFIKAIRDGSGKLLWVNRDYR